MREGWIILGYPGAGKTTATDLIASATDGQKVSLGDAVREDAKDVLGEDVESREIGNWLVEQFEAYDEYVFASWLLRQLPGPSFEGTVVIDGLRTRESLNFLREYFDEVHVVYIEATFGTRVARMKKRGRRGESEYDETYLKRRDAREDRYGVGSLIDSEVYDVRICNEDDIESFQIKLGTVLNESSIDVTVEEPVRTY